ncbi:MAG: DUF1592 domain-containing protein [Planctomycetota bacterium]
MFAVLSGIFIVWNDASRTESRQPTDNEIVVLRDTDTALSTTGLSASLFNTAMSLTEQALTEQAQTEQAQQEQDPSRELRDVQRTYLDRIRPLLQAKCGDCHWGGEAHGDFDFEPEQTLDQMLRDASEWKQVVEVVSDEEMPPADEPQLSSEEKDLLLSWLDELFNTVDCTDINPGRITIRRLNRTEYRNTIRDLTGIDYEPADDFPGDDIGYGFDNIAEVLSLPPILMEKYLDAAEGILSSAVGDPEQPELRRSFPASKMANLRGRTRPSGRSIAFITNATITRRIAIPEPGDYRIRIEAAADQATDELVEMAVSVNGNPVGQISVDAADNADFHEYSVTTHIDSGEIELGISFVNDFYERRRGDRNLFVSRIWIEGPTGMPSTHEKIIFVEPGDTFDENRVAAQTIFRRFASRAYRRPATADEVERLTGLYQLARNEGDSFEGAVRFSLQAVLVSPNFLYKVERPAGENSRLLTNYEQATALSYFLWSTMPDDVLFQAAFEDRLSGDEYRLQVQRMMDDRKYSAFVDNFFSQWFQLRSLPGFEPDPELFPGVDGRLRQFMAEETVRLAADIVARDASVLELLTADYTFVNQPLANHYGMAAELSGDDFQRVSVQQTNRSGILTHASILTLTSNPTRTSPVKRGKWIEENLLGEEPKFPDPDIMALEDQTELTGTLRQRMEQHRTDPACAACHHTMDALGFSLENFDAVGRWRDEDEGLKVDATGELPDGTVFNGAPGLQDLLTTRMQEKFLRCFAEKLLIYALGRGLEYYDECAIDQILQKAAAEDYRFSAFVIAVTESEPFRKRMEQETE